VAKGWPTATVCLQAHALGATATKRHLQSCVRWGLIRPLDDGSWSPETVRLLVLISDAARLARPLHRRVLLLRRDYVAFPIPDHIVREAMIALASASIEHPRRKIRAIVRLWNEWSFLHHEPPRWPGNNPWRGRAQPPEMPPHEAWAASLEDPNLSDAIFGAQLSFAYEFDREISAGIAPWSDSMPLEERILIVVALNLSWRPRAT
jgi:hypothetical protein